VPPEPGIRKRVVRAIASSCGIAVKRIRDADSLVARLGYDSLRMASLAIALEDEFARPLLLAEWIARAPNPEELTVGSLCEYIAEILEHEG
jgi:acyl carrier protein